MQYLAGALITALLFAVFYAGYFLGSRKQRKQHKQPDEQEIRKAEKLKKDFMDLMTYSTEKALGKKVE